MMVDLSRLTTEQRNPATMDLDQMSPLEIAVVMNQEDKKAVLAVQQVLPQVATAIQWAADSLRQGGRLIYMGAGTSGRLGVLDAVECPPTFGSAPETVVGLIAGGDCAFVKAVEGAEDSCTLGAEDLQRIHLQPPDLVIGLAASGRTPYVIHGLRYARSIGCKTVAIACNAGSLIGQEADLAIEPVTGPEVLTGSTRLKAGTAQKLILNMISTGSMVNIGKAYQNLMVDVQLTNEKLGIIADDADGLADGHFKRDAVDALDDAGVGEEIGVQVIELHRVGGVLHLGGVLGLGHVAALAALFVLVRDAAVFLGDTPRLFGGKVSVLIFSHRVFLLPISVSSWGQTHRADRRPQS